MNKKSHWDKYWLNTKSLNSFSEGTSALGYHGELLAVWHNAFTNLKPNATILDIGTGNGAIAVAAQEYAERKNIPFNVTGVDAAAINPLQVFEHDTRISRLLNSIRFIPNCHAESLPFPTQSFDLITSQFALEYADCQQALAQCWRVLKDGGQLVAVMHHAESEIARETAAGCNVLNRCLIDGYLFNNAQLLFGYLRQLEGDPDNVILLNEYKAKNLALLERVAKIKSVCSETELYWFDDFMARFSALFINLADNSNNKLSLLWDDFTAFHQRLLDQQAAALSEKSVNDWVEVLQSFGAYVSVDILHIDGQLFGWLLEAKK